MSTKPKKITPPKPTSEVKVGKITYISKEKGAFVQLLGEGKEKAEEFVPAAILANKNLSENKLVKIKKSGNNVTEIDPF
jgi:hypothetical protein